MRAGACTLQQTLTSEAASVLKQSLSLARRRGHAQVTPLHVAATLLTSKVSLLRRACVKSQQHQASHPLHQCRALELCFNVALNRLPTTHGPLLHGQPSLSNALIAALKRAQAHQRRGFIEQQQQQQQQQPLLAIKVELEQLILSILDDPSVSRAMREAGFSSTAVKNNLEDCSVSSVFHCYNSSGGIYSTPSSPPSDQTTAGGDHFIVGPAGSSIIWHSPFLFYSCSQNQIHFSPQKKVVPFTNFSIDSATNYNYLNEDIKLLVEMLLQKKRKNTVIVGDSLFITENLFSEFMVRVERGNVPEGLQSVHFLKFYFSTATLRVMKKDEVEINISDLKRKVENLISIGKGVIIYIGNLKWTVETLSTEGENECQVSGYSPVDHLVAQIGKLLSFYSSSGTRLWLLATANYQTYMRCQMKQPALGIQWALQAVSVPSGGLGLSLNAASLPLSQSTYQGTETKPFTGKGEEDFFTCCPECTSNYEKELISSKSVQQNPSPHSCNHKTSNELPDWLKPTGTNAAEKEYSSHLKSKWSRLCQSLHQRKQNGEHGNNVFSNLCSPAKNYSYTNTYQWWPSHNSAFLEAKPILFSNASMKPNQSSNSVPRFRRQQSCHIEFNFSGNGYFKINEKREQNPDSLKGRDDKEVKITLALGSSLHSDSTNNYAELKGNNVIQDSAAICEVLKNNVPWQSEHVPRILEALIDSKTMTKDVWLLFQGNDSIGKQKLALGIAKSVFGSTNLLFDINIKRTSHYREMLENALRNHDRLVLLLENVESADTEFLKFLAHGWRSGKIGASTKNEENTSQAILILTTKLDAITYSNVWEKKDSVIQMKLLVDETNPGSGIFSSDHKRKSEWDFAGKSKSKRQDNMEHVVFEFADENGKKKLSNQLSSNILDLNMKVDEEPNEDGSKELSPISSDTTTNLQDNSLGFLDLIKNRFVFNRDSTDDNHIKELILSKIKGSFGKVFGSKNQSCFAVEENILEEIFLGSGSFLDTLFEDWLKDIFETSLINIGRIDGINVTLGFGSNTDQSDLKEGFMGSCLPKNFEVSFLN